MREDHAPMDPAPKAVSSSSRIALSAIVAVALAAGLYHLGSGVAERRARLVELAAHLRPRLIVRELDGHGKTLVELGRNLAREIGRRLADEKGRIEGYGKLLRSYSYSHVLERGFAVVRDAEARLLTSAAAAQPGMGLGIEFRDGTIAASVDGARPARLKPRPARGGDDPQGSLL